MHIRGRKITSAGQRDLDRIAVQVGMMSGSLLFNEYDVDFCRCHSSRRSHELNCTLLLMLSCILYLINRLLVT